MTQQLTIIHSVVAGQTGGAERVLVELATRPGATNARHIVAVMTPNPALTTFFRDQGVTVRDRGPCHENPLAYLWRSYGPADIAWLGQVIAAEGGDILHCHTYGSHVLAARAGLRFGLPVLRTEHGVRHYRDPSCALNRHWALRHTTKIVAVSDFVARTVAEIAPHAQPKLATIRNGIDLARFEPKPPPVSGPFTIAAVSRLEPIKRLDIAVRALAQVPGVYLDIVGDGAERSRLEALAQAEGVSARVRFHGHLPDPRPVLAAADAVIACARVEALSLAVLEAAALQRPAIAFALGGLPEAVVDGRTGWLAPGDGIEAFTTVLKQASANRTEAARRGAAARAHVLAEFGITKMCAAYGAVYRSLA